MRLKYQLFLTLLAASAVLIAQMYVISSWSFSRGFLEYVKQKIDDPCEALMDLPIIRGNRATLNKLVVSVMAVGLLLLLTLTSRL